MLMDDFAGYQVIGLACALQPALLLNTLAGFFNLSPERILLNTEGDWWEKPRDERIGIVCDVKQVGGDFPLMLEFIIYDAQIKPPQTLDDVANFSKLIDCCVIVEDITNHSPYTWVVVDPQGQPTPVWVNTERLDEHDELVVDPASPNDDSSSA
jgi:hypothetical protein